MGSLMQIGDVDNRKSVSGYVFLYGGTAISWKVKKQATVTQSTAEAEYYSVYYAGQEAFHLQNFQNEIQGNTVKPTIIHCDNKAAITLSANPIDHNKLKHVDIIAVCICYGWTLSHLVCVMKENMKFIK